MSSVSSVGIYDPNARCTDSACCALSFMFLVGWSLAVWYSIREGDTVRLIRPHDYEGNVCGGGHGMESKEFKFTPDVAMEDLTFCVELCPQLDEVICRNEYSNNSHMEASELEWLVEVRDCFVATYTTVPFLFRCLPLSNSSLDSGLLLDAYMEVQASRLTIALAALAALGVSFLWLFFSFALPLTSHVTALVGNLLLLGYALWRCWINWHRNGKVDKVEGIYEMAFWVLSLLGLGYLIFMLKFTCKLKLAAEVTSLAVRFVMSSPVPLATAVVFDCLIIGHLGLCLYVAFLMASLGTREETFLPTNSTLGGYNVTIYENSNRQYYLQGYGLLALFWVTNLLGSLAFILISKQLTSWYFSEPMLSSAPKAITTVGLGSMLRHSGTVCLGSFLSFMFGWCVSLINVFRSSGTQIVALDRSVYCVVILMNTSFFDSISLVKGRFRVQFYSLGPLIGATQACFGLCKLFVASGVSLGMWTLLLEEQWSADSTVEYGVFVLLVMWITSYVVAAVVLSIVDVASKSLLTLYLIDSESKYSQHYAPDKLADFMERHLKGPSEAYQTDQQELSSNIDDKPHEDLVLTASLPRQAWDSKD